MPGPIYVDPEELNRIATACQGSSGRLGDEAKNMQQLLSQLEEAARGFPRLAVGDQFQQLNQTLAQLSTTLGETNTYISGIVTKVENFVNEMATGQ